VLRGFEGGDIKGVTQKVKEGYFTDLGINAIWMTPIVEQIHGATNEGTGKHLWISWLLDQRLD
jgi:alpha-amylase